MEKIEYWNRQAQDWMLHAGFGDGKSQIINEIRKETEELTSNLIGNAKILDIGSGANNQIYFGYSDRIFCFDISSQMLSLNHSPHKIQGKIEDSLPFRSNSFELCVSLFVMRYLNQNSWKDLMNEINRTLKPNGRFYITDVTRNKEPFQQSTFDSTMLGNIASQFGFIEIKEDKLQKKISKYVETGFGGWDEGISYTRHILFGRKPE